MAMRLSKGKVTSNEKAIADCGRACKSVSFYEPANRYGLATKVYVTASTLDLWWNFAYLKRHCS